MTLMICFSLYAIIALLVALNCVAREDSAETPLRLYLGAAFLWPALAVTLVVLFALAATVRGKS